MKRNWFIAWECGNSDPTEYLDVMALHGPLTHDEACKRLAEFHAQGYKASIVQVNSIDLKNSLTSMTH